MGYLLIVLVCLGLIFFVIDSPSAKIDTKSAVSEYLSDFDMYICIKNRLLLFPAKELNINKKYYAINLSTNNNLLRHKNINAGGFSKATENCTECLHHCPLASDEIVSIKLNFNQFRVLSNEELMEHLKKVLSEEQFCRLFKSS